MAQQIDWKTLSKEVAADRRSGKRVAISYSITVSGVTPDSDAFMDKTRTTNISEHGCCFESDRFFELEEFVTITLKYGPAVGRHQFQVMRVVPDTASNGVQEAALNPVLKKAKWLVGARLEQPISIWGVAFPPKRQPRKTGE